jgi:hypothetical protein
MITLNVLLSFVQMCSPSPFEKVSECSKWVAECYTELANPSLTVDDNAWEVCSETIPEHLLPE